MTFYLFYLEKNSNHLINNANNEFDVLIKRKEKYF